MPMTARPLQLPHPPFWFGASRPDRAAWCADHAINVMSLVGAEKTRITTDAFRERWAELGRATPTSCRTAASTATSCWPTPRSRRCGSPSAPSPASRSPSTTSGIVRGMPVPPVITATTFKQWHERGRRLRRDARGRAPVHRRADRGGRHQLHDGRRRVRRDHIRGGLAHRVAVRDRGHARVHHRTGSHPELGRSPRPRTSSTRTVRTRACCSTSTAPTATTRCRWSCTSTAAASPAARARTTSSERLLPVAAQGVAIASVSYRLHRCRDPPGPARGCRGGRRLAARERRRAWPQDRADRRLGRRRPEAGWR